MSEVSVRQLRNHTADVVRRIEAGEHLTLTVNRRPVAEISPISPGRRGVSGEVVKRIVEEAPADRGLLDLLRTELGDTTDDI